MKLELFAKPGRTLEETLKASQAFLITSGINQTAISLFFNTTNLKISRENNPNELISQYYSNIKNKLYEEKQEAIASFQKSLDKNAVQNIERHSENTLNKM